MWGALHDFTLNQTMIQKKEGEISAEKVSAFPLLAKIRLPYLNGSISFARALPKPPNCESKNINFILCSFCYYIVCNHITYHRL